MKNNKKLKLILMLLICLLIILVGLFGIFIKKSNLYKNILPEYAFASDITGDTSIEFEIDTSSETIYLDKNGKEVDSSEITEKNEKNYTKKEVLKNEANNLNEENYKKAVEIMKKRLEFLQVDQYRIDLDNKTGKIVLNFEYDYPEDIESILPMEGKLELVDSNTKDIILSYSDFTKVETTYASLDAMGNGNYAVYINLKLNNSGLEKINNLDNYKTSTTEENKVNNFKIMFDSDEIAEVSYDDMLLTNNNLRITTANNLASDSSINSELNKNTIVSKLATMGKMPVIYSITAEEYIESDIINFIDEIVKIFAIILVITFVVMTIKYKFNGILSIVAFLANISLFLIIIRLTNIPISLNGFAGILCLIVLNIYLLCNILNNIKNTNKTFLENIKYAYLKTIDSLVIILIVFVVFAFSKMTVINSMGLLIFWGWIVTILGNLIFTLPILSVANKK